ncbi:nitrate reductase molybdenum cofactor assembly chaperone [Cellvibrio sp. BR]|uniref:nitrate reductase molybdenum cofactor assembly chaperone n=1 Tax=unclassified Cellvibrio TaxID=2624793 RepID=UPI0002600C2F|nr:MULTISPECIES: nitrate reductase molybdenum cofactor assembly chaperone [unclassified Cellvibrio]EIK43238.1 nitrate reductase molybdenum cofactor assembly chaperone [Cellvibrio sp. BR]UUA75019.1 nitrate reductase molybdenum cofactor assembly chaperone [Cellvibrio sp. QJXJ]
MKLLTVLSLLMDYPEDNSDELIAVLRIGMQLIETPSQHKQQINTFLDEFLKYYAHTSLLDLQSTYDSLFERGRALSLHLFEHIHGESRDRGQAMVNLQQQYRDAGLDIGVKELPDYLPLYLEFLSTQGEENARIGLEEVAPILAVLACRLEKRNNPYAGLFHCLLLLSGAEVNLDELHAQLEQEKRDDTPEALDKVWEEEVVNFGAEKNSESCSSSTMRPTPQQSRDHVEFLNVDELVNLQASAR